MGDLANAVGVGEDGLYGIEVDVSELDADCPFGRRVHNPDHLCAEIAVPLCLILIGIPILFWWFIWSLIRIIKGLVLLNERKPIANPTSWLFG